MGQRRVGIWLIGALGNVGASVALGVAALRDGSVETTGLVSALPEFAGLDLDEPGTIEIGGHDIRHGDLASAAQAVGGNRPAFSPKLIESCRTNLDRWTKEVRPGCLLNADAASLGMVDRDDLPRSERVRKCIERLQSDIRAFANERKLDQIVVINLASTEPPANSEVQRLSTHDLTRAVERNEAGILPTSSWIAYAAIDAGFPYVNFTASAGADLPVLAELAQQRRVPIAGSDGKTGETLVRTVLAPMFYQRNLRVLSWVGHNLLGNRDGQVLSEPRNRESKLRAKDQALTNILGYSPQTLTSIDHVDSLDDWKTAWDHVHFQGFLGVPMTMQFTWQGCDSALAAPLVIDLARFTLAAQRHGSTGPIDDLSVFFKRPMGTAPHGLASQFRKAEGFRKHFEPPVMKLAFSTNAYLRFPVVDSIRRIAAIGYLGVEIAADVPHAWPAGLLEESKHAIRTVIQETGLSISNINAFMMNAVGDARQPYWHPSWIEPDRHYRQVRIDHTKRAITLARALGAPSISTEPGGPIAPGQSWAAALTQFVEAIKPVIEHAEKENVQLLVEPEPGLLIENCEQFEEFARHFTSPALGLNFDVGHFYCVAEDPATSLRRLRQHVRHIHLEDIAASRVHEHLIPGAGAIDFASVFDAIGEIGYSGWVTVELYPYAENPDEAASQAFKVITQQYRQGVDAIGTMD